MKKDQEDNLFKTENPWSIEVEEKDGEKYLYDLKKQTGDTIPLELKSNGIITTSDVDNLSKIIQDILSGDDKATEQTIFQSLNFNSIRKYLAYLQESNQLNDSLKSSLMLDAWRLNYRTKPPTMEEFLTPKYLGLTSDSLFAPAKMFLTTFWDPLKPYRNMILHNCIGLGKDQPLDAEIKMADGSVKHMGDIELGDKVKSPTEGEAEVIGIFPFNEKDVYELEMEDGRTMRCGLNHLHPVTYVKDGKEVKEVVETQFILDHPEIDFYFDVFED